MATIRSMLGKRSSHSSPLSHSSSPLNIPGSVSFHQDNQTTVLTQQVYTLTVILEELKSKVSGLERLMGTGPDEMLFGGLQDHDPLGSIRDRVMKMESVLDSALEVGVNGERETSPVVEQLSSIEQRITVNVESELRDLQDHLGDVEGRSGSQNYTFGNTHSWQSDDDLELWITTEQVPTCGVYWDLFSALVAIDGGKRLTGKELADTNFSVTRTKTTPFENDLVATMSHDLPGVFFHETSDGMLASKEEGFTKCKTYDQWMGSTVNKAYKQSTRRTNNCFKTGSQTSSPALGEQCVWNMAPLSRLRSICLMV